jgi:hypothetical protein
MAYEELLVDLLKAERDEEVTDTLKSGIEKEKRPSGARVRHGCYGIRHD